MSDKLCNRLTTNHLKELKAAFIYVGLLTDDVYENLNERLRKKNGEIDTEFGQELDRVLAKLPNFEGFAFRGTMLSSKHFAIYKAAFETDKAVTEPIFLSTSRIEAIAISSGELNIEEIKKAAESLSRKMAVPQIEPFGTAVV